MANKVRKDLELERKQKVLEEASVKLEKYIKENVAYGYDKQKESINKLTLEELLRSGMYRYVRNKDEVKKLMEEVDKCKRVVEFHNLWKEFKPIKNEIESYKREIRFIDDDDYFEYKMGNNDKITFLSFCFHHYNGNRQYFEDAPFYSAPKYNYLYGYIVYDSKGHIYLSHKNKGQGWISDKIVGTDRFDNYSWKIIDNEYIYINTDHKSAELYKLENGEYKLIRKFNNAKLKFDQELWSKKRLIVDYYEQSNIYSVEEDKMLLKNNIGSIITGSHQGYLGFHSYNFNAEREFDIQQKELIIEYLKENNLLISKKRICAEYNECYRHYDTICFLNMDGHIVSKLYVTSEDKIKIEEYDINEKTYNKDIDNLEKFYSEKMKKDFIRKEAAKKAVETKKKKENLLNQKKWLESLKELNDNSKKKTYSPKKNDKKQD